MPTPTDHTLWQIADPQIVERLQYKMYKNRFSDFIGLQYTTVAHGLVEAMLPMKDELRQQNDFLHGGVTAALCDIVAGFAAYTLLPIEQQVVTSEIKVSYYHPAIGTVFYAKGWVAKAGKKMHFCESELYVVLPNGERKVCAKATASMIVIEQPAA